MPRTAREANRVKRFDNLYLCVIYLAGPKFFVDRIPQYRLRTPPTEKKIMWLRRSRGFTLVVVIAIIAAGKSPMASNPVILVEPK